MRRAMLSIIMFASLTAGTVSLGGVASAEPKISSLEITGLTYAEADVSIPANDRKLTDVSRPQGDRVVGGGAYEVRQGLGQDLVYSSPNSNRGWQATFNDQGSESNTGVVVVICAPASRLLNYSVQNGASILVPQTVRRKL